MATDSSYGNWSPRSSALSGDGDNNNPPAQRTPWAQVVRGEQEAVSAAPSSSPPPPSVATVEEATFPDSSASMVIRRDNSDDNNSNVDHPKKPAWNKPLNGVVPIGPLIGGAVSWPPLSESTRPPPKSTSDSSKHSSVITTQGPVISHSPQNQKHTNTNSSPEFSPNHTMPVRHRSSRRGGVGGGAGVGSVQSGYTRPPLPPPLPPPFPSVDLSYGSLVVTPTPDSSLREHPYRGYTWEERPFGGFVPQSHSVNYQSSHRRGNFGGRFQGDGLHHNSHHRSGRDQHRDWNASRSSNARGVHVPQQAAASPRGLIRPPPPPLGSIPFITPPHAVRPFGNPLGFGKFIIYTCTCVYLPGLELMSQIASDLTLPFPYVPTLPPEAYSEVPFTAHGPPPPPPPPPPPALPLPMFFPGLDPPLPTLLVHQIDYYFR
ncbi:hypothetical protein U1Q18_006023 [Sarracenia purpurea var. burkii]